jgi:hypothetical protein
VTAILFFAVMIVVSGLGPQGFLTVVGLAFMVACVWFAIAGILAERKSNKTGAAHLRLIRRR